MQYKFALILFMLLFTVFSLFGEDSKKITFKKPAVVGQVTRIEVNRIDMALENNGNTGLDGDTYYPAGTNTSFLFAAGPCLSGYVNGQLRTAWMASASRIYETQAGKWQMDPTDPRAKFYEVDSDDTQDSTGYIEWAEAVALGAGFQDVNGNGVYDPENGDRPDILGDKTIWCVYNDGTDIVARTPRLQTPPLGLEVHQTVWGFNRGDALGDVVFFRFRLINPTANDIVDLIFTGWTDPDLGDPYDDLIACDTTVSLGYIYNFQDDLNYGPNPPAFGIDFFQGPIVETGNPTDTAFVAGGPFFGVDTIPGWVNLPMTSFMYYIQSDPVLGDPDLAIVARRYQEGGLDKEGLPIDPTSRGSGGTASTDPRYIFSGDPVSGEGWLDDTPDDKRFMSNCGPFQLAAGDTQDIVLAYVVGRSGSALSSVTKLKENDVLAQASYDNNFKAAPPIPKPKVNVRTFEEENKIELVIDMYDWFEYKDIQDVVGFVQFEGMKIYQFNSESTEDEVNGRNNAILIGSFDLDNEYGDIYTETDLGPQRVYQAVNNIDEENYPDPRGRYITFTVTTDAFDNNNPLVSFKEYYFSVIPFAVNTVLAYPNDATPTPNDWVIPGGPLELTRQAGFFRATPSGATNRPFYDLVYDPESDGGVSYEGSRTLFQGSVGVSTISQGSVTAHDYQVRFIDGGNLWQLVDLSDNSVKIDSFSYQGTTFNDWAFPVVDGVSVKVLNVANNIDTADVVDAETDSVWLRGREFSGFSEFATFDNGVDMVKDIQDLPDFRSINLNSQINKEQYFPVKLVFNTSNSSKGYFYNRSTPLYLPNFYGGLADTYLEAYDVTDEINPRKLNIVYNATNGELVFVQGNRNLIFIMATDYSEDDLYDPGNANGREFREDAYLVINLEQIDSTTVQAGKMTLLATPFFPNSEADVFQFSTQTLRGVLTQDQQISELDKIKVVPNPYFGYSGYETSYDRPVLKFTHLGNETTIRIFTLAGQLVQTLQKNGPESEISWDLRNENGLRIASGMYIAHVEVKGVGERIIKFAVIQREERIDRF
ncbi:MAG: T9SS type A sorting domain-containing protein [bacterium]|nr:MAG: T9SS type A sorting domain-containing protein [bacterium]